MSHVRPAALVASLSLLAAAGGACSTKRDGAATADSGSVSAGATPAAVDSAANGAPPAAAAPVAPADTARAGATVNATPAPAAGTTPRTPDSGRNAKAASTAPAAAPATTKPAPPRPAATPSSRPGTARGVPGGATPGATYGAAATPGAGAGPAPSPQASAGTPEAGGAQGGPVKVNRFMSYDANAKKVTLDVIAAFNNQQGGFNFNGGSNGSQTITVPAGWQVAMHVENVDAIPHSVIVIADERPLPNAPDAPAIPRAYSAHVSDGLAPQNGEDDLSFRASKPGNYLIYCGVPGHGPSGMFIKFVVSESATVPSYQM